MQGVRAARLRGRSPAVEGGVSLIELMVGLALGVVVVFALVTLFDNNSRARRHVDQATQQIENGRYALDLLRDDLHLAGYYGNAVPWQGIATAAALATAPDVCATTVANLLFSATPTQWPVPVFGIAAGDAVPACVSGATGGHKAGTGILVVRRTKTIPTAIGGLVGASIYVQVSGCNAELQQHKDFVVALGSGGAGAFALHARGCVNTAEVYEFQTRIYYVSNETVPTLRLLTLSGTTSTNEPLVEGVEDMRIEYGMDNVSGDGSPDVFRKCLSTENPPCSTGAAAGANVPWANMMAVQVHLLARNIDILVGHTDTKTYALTSDPADTPAGPFNDSYKRHVYSAVVRLMNPAGRREL